MKARLNKTYPSVTVVSTDEHQGMVREIFSTIPLRYDLLNRMMSLHQDVAWRRFAVERMHFARTNRFLDLATGTADLAIEAALRYPQIEVAALDFVRGMITVGAEKIRKYNLANRIRLLQADALELPFGDGFFDCVAIAFGIRNISERMKALEEMTRVTVSGGRVLVLEMHYPQHPLFRWVYRLYLIAVLPFMARAFSKNPGAYRYLSDSIIHFPTPAVFAQLMRDAGLAEIRQYPLTLGATYLHVGVKP
jgi:demethylmenaquinone methyltransferase/2-methoxy-6-polyprenyl-1,4-benzoquinol methylase